MNPTVKFILFAFLMTYIANVFLGTIGAISYYAYFAAKNGNSIQTYVAKVSTSSNSPIVTAYPANTTFPIVYDGYCVLNNNGDTVSRKSKTTVFLLSILAGWVGADRFYLGWIAQGVLKLIFGPATCYIWQLVDWICVLCDVVPDINLCPLRTW